MGPVKPGPVRQLVLVEAALEPQRADALAEPTAEASHLVGEVGGFRGGHAVIVTPARRKGDLLL